MELADALNDVLSSKWRDLRGIEIVSFGVNSVKANEEDEAKLQKVQMGAMMSNPEMRMGTKGEYMTNASVYEDSTNVFVPSFTVTFGLLTFPS